MENTLSDGIENAEGKMTGRGRALLNTALRKWGTFAFFVALNIFFCISNPYYGNINNFSSIIYEASVATTISIGLTIVVMVGSFDLSVGALTSFGGMIAGLLMPTIGVIPACLASLCITCLFGLANGFLVGIVGISGIIVTLAMQFISTGIEVGITGGYEIGIPLEFNKFLFFGSGTVGGIKIMVFFLVAMAIIAHFFMTKSVYGMRISATGDNALAAIYSGIKIKRTVILGFILSAAFSAIAGIMIVGMNASHQPVVGKGYLLDAFAIVFLGSTIFKEGKPHILGTVIAGIMLSSLITGMMMSGVRYEWQMFTKGAVLISAVAVSSLLRKEEIHTQFI